MDTTENYSLGTKLESKLVDFNFFVHSTCGIKALLYYDHLLTFDDEVEFIWSRPNHIFLICGQHRDIAIDVLCSFRSICTSSCSWGICHPWEEFQEFFHALAQIIVATLLTMRVYALYARDRRVLIALTGIIVFGIGATVTSLVFSKSTPAPSLFPIGCHDILDLKNAALVSVGWELVFIYDTLLFGMTVFKAYQARLQPKVKQLEKFSVFAIIVRDGSVYFGIMALANLVNVLTFYLAGRYTIPLRQLHVCYSYVALDAASSQNHESRPICMKITTPKKVPTTQGIFRYQKVSQARAILEFRVLRRLTLKSWRFERKAVMDMIKYTGIASNNQACICIGPENVKLEAYYVAFEKMGRHKFLLTTIRYA
ncbi:hypothetical protein EV368DRAFT_66713 [Lentinula lateritia]|nr:hypothetical protein EV368DRAFT_66713 [Lentinula lateritia]